MSTEYIKLLDSGNILFQNWSATIYCDEKSSNTIKVNFGMTEDNENVIGVRSREVSTVNSIGRTIKFLKKCNDGWLAHLNKKRVDFVELNHFKTRQISKLREKLAHFILQDPEETRIDKELVDLLMSLNNQVDYKAVHLANMKAFESLNKEKVEKVVAKVKSERTTQQISNNNFDPALEAQVIESLIEKGGFSR